MMSMSFLKMVLLMDFTQLRLAPPARSTCRSDTQNTRRRGAQQQLLLLLLEVVVVPLPLLV